MAARSTMSMGDPRFTTTYLADFRGVPYAPVPWARKTLPALVQEKWCRPGYQAVRPDKGVMLYVNDYPPGPDGNAIQYGGSLWPEYVYTDLISNN